MATYKVIQDVEAEDKFVGPLTLKQFIFACGGVLFGYLNIFALTRGAPWLMGLFLPPMGLAFFLAVPWSRDQPTEMWVIARLKFLTQPRKRIWDQSGIQELVTITAPKKQEESLTKDYSETEVKSRLHALAETIDSRGWAIKHASQEEGRPQTGGGLVSDRLIDASSVMPDQVPDFDVEAVPDVMDPSSNPLSGNINSMIQTRGDKRKDELLQKMDKARRGESLQSRPETKSNISMSQPKPANPSLDEQMLNKQLRAKKQAEQSATSHMRGIKPNNQKQANPQAQKSSQQAGTTPAPHDSGLKSQKSSPATNGSTTEPQEDSNQMTSKSSTDTIRLANNNDLNIATLAREAERNGESSEVVISLH